MRVWTHPAAVGLGLVLLAALAPTRVFAQGAPGSGQGTAPPRQPPPPLFPRHRRGIYRNNLGIEVIDATPQSPPLETDDPGVPDKGEYEINLFTHADLSKDDRSFDLLFIDANYGIAPRIAGHELPTQLKFEIPVMAARGGHDPYTLGMGDAKFGVKFNFYTNEHSGLSVALYPQVEFEAPGTDSIEKGLAEHGQTLMLPLLVAREFHYFTLVANGTLSKPVHDPDRESTTTLGIGIGRALRRKIAAMIEVRNESAVDFTGNHLMFLNVGLMHGLTRVLVYTQLGHTLYSDDGVGHGYIGVGMKFMLNQRRP